MARVKIGPSWSKVPLDLALALTALGRAWKTTRRYDAVHSHEEGGAIGVWLARLLRIPHLYDMHSSLPQQVANFGYGESTRLARALGWLERLMIRRSRVVVVICPELETAVRQVSATVPTVLIENAPGSGAVPVAGSGQAVRASLGLADGTPIALYTGTFEAYQGLDMLLDGMAQVVRVRGDAKLVLVGGEPDQVARVREQARTRGVAGATVFVGRRPVEEMPAYLDAATVLVSPRSTGTNTPLKIYQYLRSARPIVATRLRTHTQVLSDETAFLVDPTPEGLAGGILAALADPATAEQVGHRARQLAETKYTDDAFIAKTRLACDALIGDDRTHYSYSHYASRRVAEEFDALRFSGPIGRYLLESQQALLLSVVAPVPGRTVLDVGTGTGRAAIGLAKAGADVVGVDASDAMLEVARARAAGEAVAVRFEVADAHKLPFPDRDVDAAVSLRLIMHTPDWRQCVAELCRVSRWRVIVDFPALGSVAALESAARQLARAAGRRVEAYRVIPESAVRRALESHGFRLVSVHRQFVLPIALHKRIGSLGATKATERALRAVGLLRLLGSPVTMVAER